MPTDPYTPAELDAVAKALFDFNASGVEHHSDNWTSADFAPEAKLVLDAAAPLIAARVRAAVAEEIAQHVEENPGPNPSPAIPAWWAGWVESRDDSAAIARAHATTEEDTDATA